MESDRSSALHRVVGQLRELREKATPGPWAIANWGHTDEPHMVIEGPEIPKPSTRDGFWFGGQKAVDWGDEWSAENAALIVAAINTMPALLAIAEASQSYMAIRHPNGDLMTTTTFSPEMDKAAIALMDALSLLPNTVLGGCQRPITETVCDRPHTMRGGRVNERLG